MTKLVSQRIDCIVECAFEPCCRSINYKKTSKNETNCEMLHDRLDTNYTTTKLLNESSYDYVYLTNPTKVNVLLTTRANRFHKNEKPKNFLYSELQCKLPTYYEERKSPR